MGINPEEKKIMIDRIVEREKTIEDYELLRKLYILVLRLTEV